MMTIDEIIAAVSRDIPFYKKSDGGVTLSGGEPLLQGKFAINLLRVMRKHGLHTAVESALNVPEDILESAAGQADFFLADIKLVDEKRHREATGISNKRILENIVRLDSLGVEYCLRIPLIGGVNDDGEAMTEIAKFSGGLKRPKYVEFLPYHKFGEAKYITLGVERKTNLATPSKEEMRTLAGLFGGVEVRYQGSAD
jgi:pyruvate formate lyase activating enzyme